MRDTVARKFFPRPNEKLMIHYEETEVRSKTAILSFPYLSFFLFLGRRSRFDKYWSVDRSRGYCQATSTWLFSHNSKTFPQRTSVLHSIFFFFSWLTVSRCPRCKSYRGHVRFFWMQRGLLITGSSEKIVFQIEQRWTRGREEFRQSKNKWPRLWNAWRISAIELIADWILCMTTIVQSIDHFIFLQKMLFISTNIRSTI